MDDCRKCQTATATPAEPGDLLWMLASEIKAGGQDSAPSLATAWADKRAARLSSGRENCYRADSSEVGWTNSGRPLRTK